MKDMLVMETQLAERGYRAVAGVDEAGRGPLAGRVYAAAVILPADVSFKAKIDDSKKLTEKKREAAFEEIIRKALSYSIAYVDEAVIDEINILNATHRAMCEAVRLLSPPADYVIIDGNSIKGLSLPHETVVGGDAKSLSIAAASILAKVSRDRYIVEQAKLYPQYGFEKHKGYGTREHLEMIRTYGPCPIHRKTFRGVREYVK